MSPSVPRPCDPESVVVPPWLRAALDGCATVASKRTFFVVGCQKSGTTWVCRLLDAHPALCCGAEAHVSDLLAPLLQQAHNAYNASGKANWTLPAGALYASIRVAADGVLARYLDRRPDDPAAIAAIGDKTPEGAVALPALALLYPDASFVHVVRDGRDAAVSGWAHLERQGDSGRFDGFADYAGFFAREHWVPYVTAARAAATTMPGRCIEIRYEDLHAEPTDVVARMLGHLGVADDPDATRACVEAAAFERTTGGRTPGEEDRASHLRKGVVGDWRNAFDAEALARFEDAAGPLLRELGYAEQPVSAAASGR